MPDLPCPVRLEPRFLPKPWGGRRIESVLRRPLPAAAPVGESWEVYDREGSSNRIVGGPLDGRRLHDALGGRAHPLLVKILDAAQPLSVQVHPDENAAARFGGEAKSECWFVLHADPGARLYRGLRDGCTRSDLEEALAANRVESCLHSFEVAAGDTVFVPAGTLHTIGAGVLLAEVQQNSDSTYRLYDWGRKGLDGLPRELHVEKALESIHFGPRSEDKIPSQEIEDVGSLRRLLLVKSRHFSAEHFTGMGTFTLETAPATDDWPQILHVLAGTGQLRPFDRNVDPIDFEPGATILLPARYESFEVAPGATIFRALVLRT